MGGEQIPSSGMFGHPVGQNAGRVRQAYTDIEKQEKRRVLHPHFPSTMLNAGKFTGAFRPSPMAAPILEVVEPESNL